MKINANIVSLREEMARLADQHSREENASLNKANILVAMRACAYIN
ncbi:hypothetical protein [Prosthecobacter sp.]